MPLSVIVFKKEEQTAKVLLHWFFNSTCYANMHRYFLKNEMKTK
jgi:hypothetical protein